MRAAAAAVQTLFAKPVLRTPDDKRATLYRQLVQDLSEIARRTSARA